MQMQARSIFFTCYTSTQIGTYLDLYTLENLGRGVAAPAGHGL